MQTNSNMTLTERAKYAPESFTSNELVDLIAELEAWREFAYDYNLDDAAQAAAMVDELDANQENPDHADYDDLKSFFHDCVQSLRSDWPCPEAYDNNLRQVICDAITNGDKPCAR